MTVRWSSARVQPPRAPRHFPQTATRRSLALYDERAGALLGAAPVLASAQAHPDYVLAEERLATPHAPLLTDNIANAFRKSSGDIAKQPGVDKLASTSGEGRCGGHATYDTTSSIWLDNSALAEEIFGPYGILVTVVNDDDFMNFAKGFEGQLTCTLQIDRGDYGLASKLLPILERKAGRILANGFPTGVEVCDAMIHGGPYPASTNFGATSVGTLAIRRFLRPVCYQNIPEELLPDDLRS